MEKDNYNYDETAPLRQAKSPINWQADPVLNGLMAYPSLLVKQKPRGAFLEFLFGYESENEYKIYDPQQGNAHILTAREESDCCSRNFCGKMRPYTMSIRTITGHEVCRFERPLHCRRGGLFCCCCGDYFFQVITVYAGADTASPGELLGYVREECTVCQPKFSIINAYDETEYAIVGDCCGCCNYHLGIYGADNDSQEIGEIQKMWSGLGKELFTDADNFFVTFPQQSTAPQRALFLAGLFLVDFLFFENNQRNNNN